MWCFRIGGTDRKTSHNFQDFSQFLLHEICKNYFNRFGSFWESNECPCFDQMLNKIHFFFKYFNLIMYTDFDKNFIFSINCAPYSTICMRAENSGFYSTIIGYNSIWIEKKKTNKTRWNSFIDITKEKNLVAWVKFDHFLLLMLNSS